MSKVLNILIVEDEPLTRVFLKRLILSYGHNIVAIASEGKEALNVISNNDIDLIFMDINIHGSMDGITVIKQMKPLNEPIVYFLSAYTDKETIEDALSTEAYSYISKPIKEEDIYIALTLTSKIVSKIVPSSKLFLAKEFYIDKNSKELFFQQKHIKLSKIEKEILDLFVLNLNANVSVQQLKAYVWGVKEVSDSTIRSALHNLKKKVPTLNIKNNVGRGYILMTD